MTKKKRTTVRFNDLIELKVEVLMQRRSFTNFTAFLEQLIRDDWDVRATPEMEEKLVKLLKNVPAQRTRGSRKRNPATGVPISQAIVEAVAQLHGLPEGERKPASAKRSSPSPKHKQGGRRRSSQKGVPKEQGR